MAIKALTIGDTFEYVLDADPSKTTKDVPVDPADPAKGTRKETLIEPGATIFGLKALDVFLMGYIYDNASSLRGKQGSDEVGIHTRMNQTNIDTVRFGLAWVKNFQDSKGNEVSITKVKATVNGREYDAASDNIVSLLGLRAIGELAQQIKEASEIGEDEEKNSEA